MTGDSQQSRRGSVGLLEVTGNPELTCAVPPGVLHEEEAAGPAGPS